jgi:CheY-like chemotaxis protein
MAGDALPAGIAAWLANPVRPAQLYGAVAHLVGRAAPVKGIGTQAGRSTVAPAQDGERRGRILVAEGNLVNQLVTVHLVEALGYQVETVEDGRGAVTAVERGAYELVLMDCHMPQMDGFTATTEIRRREERSGRHTPIIALTADALSGDAEKCLAAGMDDYLAKPVTPERLREVVARWARAN